MSVKERLKDWIEDELAARKKGSEERDIELELSEVKPLLSLIEAGKELEFASGFGHLREKKIWEIFLAALKAVTE